MDVKDARTLTVEAKQELRQRTVRAVLKGMTQTEAARVFGVSRQAVAGWMKAWRARGAAGLKTKRMGRPPGSGMRLAPHQAALTVRAIVGRCPDQLRLPFALWTREAVQMLLKRKFGVEASVWTVGRMLKRWGLTPQKPLRRAYEKNPEEVRRWLKEEYPAIRARAAAEGAEIHWGDEMGLRSDHQAGRSYGRRGETPVIPGTGRRFRCNVVSTVTNRGQLAFMVFPENFTERICIRFLRRLLKHAGRKVFWIVDRHPVHRGSKVTGWLGQNRPKIERFFLPAYSPELNPDELLNQDVKSNAGRHRPKDLTELVRNTRGYLRGTQRRPDIVRNYFNAEHVRYAAQ
jgi:transposase